MIRKGLSLFAEIAQGFIDNDRLKLVLFANGVKPATFVALKIYNTNLGEKFRFEQHLKYTTFVASRARSFEEISRIQKNKIIWGFNGIWIGYDLFDDKPGLEMFKKYVSHVRKKDHKKADKIGGMLYGYPSCCTDNFIKEHDAEYIKKNFSCYEFYKRAYGSVRKFPFVVHTPCSLKCRETAKLNRLYKRTVKKKAPKFYKDFSRKKVYATELLVDTEHDIFDGQKTIWPVKDGHQFSVIAKTPYEGRHYIYSYLTKDCYERGTVLDAKVTMKYNYADIRVKKVKGMVRDMHHVRKFKMLGRNF